MAFGRSSANVWDRNGIKLANKLKVYNALVKPTLLYSCMHVRPGQCTNVMQSDLTISTYKLLLEDVKTQVARQGSRHRGPEESRDAKHAYSLKASTAKMDWLCYKNA